MTPYAFRHRTKKSEQGLCSLPSALVLLGMALWGLPTRPEQPEMTVYKKKLPGMLQGSIMYVSSRGLAEAKALGIRTRSDASDSTSASTLAELSAARAVTSVTLATSAETLAAALAAAASA
ncbi:MAG: hypothetical protein FRX49_12674 [Trebouxia sp. A1-2]|nr:MAG: hypothetical protein FRX49_12674 [Trebouxia sp. A1-2]